MDPVSVIVAALVAGASGGVKDAASEALRDAYAGLKVLVKEKFADRPPAEVALEEHENAPEVWDQVLRQQITETGADRDGDILAAAEAVLEQVPAGTRVGNVKVVVNDHGRVGVVGHGDNTVNMGDSTPQVQP